LKTNRLLAGTLTLVLIAGLVTPAFAQSTTGNEADIQNVLVPLQLDEVNCNVDSGDIVGIVTSNGFTGNSLDNLIPALEADNFVIRTVSNIANGIPECVVKIAIFNTDGGACQNTPFTQAELDSIEDYVNNGGALALFNELSGCSSTNAISQVFGETPNANSVPNEVMTPGVNFDPNNPATLFDGINEFHYNAAGGDYQPSPDAVITHVGTGNPVMIAKESGEGCVLMIGDGDWIQRDFILAGDNLQMGVNIFKFLNECISPIVGGEFLPIDSTALLLAGLQTSAIWIIPTLAGLAGAGFYLIKFRTNKE